MRSMHPASIRQAAIRGAAKCRREWRSSNGAFLTFRHGRRRCWNVRSRQEDEDGAPLDTASGAAEVESILIPWFAFQSQSMLAAEAFVECVVCLYRSGWTVRQVQMELSFDSLLKRSQARQQLGDLDNDMLLSFVTLIMITCKEVRCPMYPDIYPPEAEAGATPEEPVNTQLAGLEGYARQTLQQYANGATLRAVTEKQETAVAAASQAASGSGPLAMSPNMVYMQNLTRIVLLTIENLQQAGFARPRELLVAELRERLALPAAPIPFLSGPPTARETPTGYAFHMDPRNHDALETPCILRCAGRLTGLQRRWLAVKLLLSFMGATLGWAISWNVFIETALLAYLSGSTAQEIYDELAPVEFAQVGSIFRVAAGTSAQSKEVNSEAFGRWLSSAYITWALMGVPHDQGSSSDGWAWVQVSKRSQDSAVVATAVSNFVARSLKQLAAEDAPDSIPGSNKGPFRPDVLRGMDEIQAARLLQKLKDEATQKRIDRGFMLTKIADPNLARDSSAMNYMLQQLAVVRLAREAALKTQKKPVGSPKDSD